MSPTTNNKQDDSCKSGACPPDANSKNQDGKLVKSTDLPLIGNPYPPKDVIEEDRPGSIELGVRSVRTTIQPYLAPFCKAYNKTSDVLSIGAAHTQSTIHSLTENRNQVLNPLIIAGSGLLGLTLARRKGFFKKFLYGSLFFGGAIAACYPNETKKQGQIALHFARNKLPGLMAHQYDKLSGKQSTTNNTEAKQEPSAKQD